MTLAPRPWLTAFGFGELRAEVGGSLDHDVAFGPGLRLGIELGARASRWRTRLEASGVRFVAGDEATVLRVAVQQRLTLSRRWAFVAGFSRGCNLSDTDQRRLHADLGRSATARLDTLLKRCDQGA